MKAMRIDDAQIRMKGIEVLNRTLGSTGALRFLTLLHREPTDYVEISRRLYEGQTIEEIFERAKKQWKD
ncbi:MAG: hypothetical protein DRQ02_05910 [Candidatus Latescibacterota bacterium]|nr:hypothetical protein [Candidatus Latescibacterota bacterium]RKY67899.1 MAG: hypothetical protein DRQ02_05910 [Candidatus Latescibacterota bacterium]RKY71014.1 MAG: hypothetical protein DRQ24_08215 [Candidatus Latescibacterota bacterium]